MAVTMGMVFGGTVGLVAGGATAAGRAMAVGNGPPMVRFVGFAAEKRGESFSVERGALAKSTRNEPKGPLLALSGHRFRH